VVINEGTTFEEKIYNFKQTSVYNY